MNHLTEEQLILHYYGEEGETLACEQHLDACEECRAVYGSLQRVLNVVDSLPVPERSAEYGAEVWGRLESRIPARRRFRWAAIPTWRWATAGVAFAGLLVAAFLAGTYYRPSPGPGRPATTLVKDNGTDPQVRERVLLVAVGDYLERSQMVLIELANANPANAANPKGPMDVSYEQERAADLITENRLYRQTADHTGNTAVSSVLDELDRVLLEIAHAPSQWTSEDMAKFRQRLEAEGILFKIRVLGSNVRNHEEAGTEGNAPANRRTL